MAKRKPISKEEQRRRFEQAAREAGADTRDKTLERIVRQIAKPSPKPAKPYGKKSEKWFRYPKAWLILWKKNYGKSSKKRRMGN